MKKSVLDFEFVALLNGSAIGSHPAMSIIVTLEELQDMFVQVIGRRENGRPSGVSCASRVNALDAACAAEDARLYMPTQICNGFGVLWENDDLRRVLADWRRGISPF